MFIRPSWVYEELNVSIVLEMGGIGWYGPLIHLSDAPSHVGDYVQVLVFVHQCPPPQRLRASNGRQSLKATLQVGDNTLPYFSISLWQKHVESGISAGDVILLENVKITKFRDVVEATTVQHSSLSILARAHELLSIEGMDKLIDKTQVGNAVKEKLNMVTRWAKDTQSILLSYLSGMLEQKERPCKVEANQKPYKNWLCNERSKFRHCTSIAEAISLRESCLVSFFGNIGEICLPANICKFDASSVIKEWMFVSKRLSRLTDNEIIKVFIRTGCKHCGFPMEAKKNSTYCTNQSSLPQHCGNNFNQIHSIGWIYSPFLLHLWDQSAHIPVLVKNLAAQLLFGSISAESLSQSLEGFHPPNTDKGIKISPSHDSLQDSEGSQLCPASTADDKRDIADDALVQACKQDASKKVIRQMKDKESTNKIDFPKILLILLRTLFRKNENSPFQFQVLVGHDAAKESGMWNCAFELVSFKIPLEC